MNDSNIIGKLKILDVAIGKKMFDLTKVQKIKNPPSPLQFKILEILLNSKGKDVCQKTLEMNLNVSKATVSGALATMENNGIIKRTTSGLDAREKNIQLTNLSIKRFEEMKNIHELINKKLVENISEKNLNVFLSVLDNMKKNIDKIEG